MSPPDRITADHLDNLIFEARFYLRHKNDRVRALGLAMDAYARLDNVDATDEQRCDFYGDLADVLLDLGDEERCEPLAIKAIELEATFAEPRHVILGTRRLFYAQFLRNRERFPEAARFAREGLAAYAQGVPPDYHELVYLRQVWEPLVREYDEEQFT